MFGALAKKLAKPAASIPISAVILARTSPMSTARPDQALEDVAQLFVGGNAQMAVIDHGKALGVVTRDALAGSIASDGRHTPVGLVAMGDVVVVGPNDPLLEVLEQLDENPGAVALVLDHGSPVGMVTREQLDAYLEAQG